MAGLLSREKTSRSCCHPLVLALVLSSMFVQLFFSFNGDALTDAMLVDSVQMEAHRRTERCSNHEVLGVDDGSALRDSILAQRRDAVRVLEEFSNVSISSLSVDTLRQLPTKEEWETMYGKGIVVVGEESCTRYREQVPLKNRFMGPAGMFNTGTNMFNQLAERHLVNKDRSPALSALFQVPWGKHRPVTERGKNTAKFYKKYNITEALPVVLLRDPLHFLQSLCVKNYQAMFKHTKRHCPNLIPTSDDRQYFGKKLPDVVNVRVNYTTSQPLVHHDSLIHYWSDWYRDYVKIPDYPVLYVRMEDILMHPDEVLSRVAKCMGISIKKPILMRSSASKKHGSGTDLIGALAKSANQAQRVKNMTLEDMNYVREHVDKELLDMFHYSLPDDEVKTG